MKAIILLFGITLCLWSGNTLAQGKIDDLSIGLQWKYEAFYVEEAIEDGEVAGTKVYGQYGLPDVFSFRAQIKVLPKTDPRSTEKWRHIIEVGVAEYQWNAPFRLEVGDEGEWYVAVGDGTTYSDITINSGWKYNTDLYFLFAFANGEGKVYENGVLIGTLKTNLNISNRPGTVVVGSKTASNRFFEGSISNVSFQSGILCAYRCPNAEELKSYRRYLNLQNDWRYRRKTLAELQEQNKMQNQGVWTICIEDYPVE